MGFLGVHLSNSTVVTPLLSENRREENCDCPHLTMETEKRLGITKLTDAAYRYEVRSRTIYHSCNLIGREGSSGPVYEFESH